MRLIISLVAAMLLFAGCEKSDDKIKTASEQPINAATSASIKVEKKENNQSTNKQNDFIKYDMHGEKSVKFGLEDNNVSRQIGALAMVKSPLQTINLRLIKGRLSKNFITKCSACHDDYANGIIGPSLLTKSEDEIFNMISAYKNKEKVNVLMRDLVKKMDNDEIRKLAKEISDFNTQFRSK
ncbi:c-type cytochrome [Campylobacter sp.]|uniref:c-type cytochrome n=1 Tax=Campylobacter sp. TaxID=205 RepID=UPI003FA0E6CB